MSSCLFQQQQQKGGENDKENEKAQEAPPLCLGAVHQVYPEQNFVLLRIIGPMPAPGTTLITHPPDGSTSRLGNVSVTSEKAARNGIIAADVRAGTVLRGDRVFLYRDVSTHTPKEEEENTEVADTPRPLDGDNPGPVTDNEHPRVVNAPVAAKDADIPDPVLDGNGDDTAIEQKPQEDEQDKPSSVPLPSGSPGTAPSYLDDIPDNIDGWN